MDAFLTRLLSTINSLQKNIMYICRSDIEQYMVAYANHYNSKVNDRDMAMGKLLSSLSSLLGFASYSFTTCLNSPFR
jgi:hypothetical protein